MAGRAGAGAGMVEERPLEEVGLLLHPPDRVRDRDALPLLLDAVTAFRPDAELYRPWRAVNNTPFWTPHPTLEHFAYLFRETMFGTWLCNTMFIAVVSTLISIFCGILAGYALARLQVSPGGRAGHQHLRDVPGAADPALHPPGRHHPELPARGHARGPDPDLPDVPHPVLHLAPDGLLQDHPARSWRSAPASTAPAASGAMVRIIFPIATPGILSAGHLRLHPVLERVHLRARVPLLAPAEDGAGGRGVAS